MPRPASNAASSARRERRRRCRPCRARAGRPCSRAPPRSRRRSVRPARARSSMRAVGDPLEAGERLVVERRRARARCAPSSARGDDGGHHERGPSRPPVAGSRSVVPEQHADLVAGELPVAARRRRAPPRRGGRRRDRWRGRGRRFFSAASARTRSIAPGSSGFGKRTVGKRPSGSNCSSTGCTCLKPASARALITQRPPTPCIGGVDDGHPLLVAMGRTQLEDAIRVGPRPRRR